MTNPPSGARREPLRLHVGGTTPKEGWKILNTLPGPDVDFLGDCKDLSQFADNSVAEIYGSHVYEHLDYASTLIIALREANRVLEPGGLFRLAVPDLDVLCKLFVHPDLTGGERWHVMRMIYGGHVDEFDYHYGGYNFELMSACLEKAGFANIRRVENFGLFNDTSTMIFLGVPISLNMQALKPA